jgi:hypothetical protein
MPAAAVVAGGSLASSLVGGIMGNKASKAAQRAAQEAQRYREGLAGQSRQQFGTTYNRNMGIAGNTYDTGVADTNRFYGQAGGAVNAGVDQARGDLTQGYGQAIGTLSPYANPNTVMGLYDMMGVARPGESAARPYSFQAQDPSYQWRLNQGQTAQDRSAASRGLLLSGAQLKASQAYGQNLASTEYGNQFNRLAGLANNAQSAAGNIATLQGQEGRGLAELARGQGQDLGNLYTGQAGALNTLGARNAQLQTGLGENYATNIGSVNQNLAAGGAQTIQDAGAARASGYENLGKAINSGIGTLTQFGAGGGFNGLSSLFNQFGSPAAYGSGMGPNGVVLRGSTGMLGGRV